MHTILNIYLEFDELSTFLLSQLASCYNDKRVSTCARRVMKRNALRWAIAEEHWFGVVETDCWDGDDFQEG